MKFDDQRDDANHEYNEGIKGSVLEVGVDGIYKGLCAT